MLTRWVKSETKWYELKYTSENDERLAYGRLPTTLI